MLNPTDQNIRIKANKKLAKVSLVSTDDLQYLESQNTSVSSLQTNDTNSEELQYDLSESDLTETEKEKLQIFLKKNRSSFATNMSELGKTDLYKHKIVTVSDARHVRSAPYRQTPPAQRNLESEIQELLKNDIIEESNSEWFSPVVMVKKKNGEFRLAVDYRKLNKVTVPMSFPLPHIESVFDALGESKAKYFTI